MCYDQWTMNELASNKRCSHIEWTTFAASERTSLNRSTDFTINEPTSNIQRTLCNESRMCTINERAVYNQWTTRKQRRILDYNNYSLVSVIQFSQCANIVHYSKFIHWLCYVRSLIVTQSLNVNVNFGGFCRP